MCLNQNLILNVFFTQNLDQGFKNWYVLVTSLLLWFKHIFNRLDNSEFFFYNTVAALSSVWRGGEG